MTDTLADAAVPGAGTGSVPAPDGPCGPAPPMGGRAGRARALVGGSWDRFCSMPVEGYVSLVVVGSCVVFTLLQLSPANLLADTTPAGGDMGAHVWGPAYLRDTLLPSFRLSGWTPDWYAGFPAYQFYMVVPSLAIALLSYVIPYGIAFKLVTVSGVLTLPVATWAYGRLTRMPFPVPPLLAVAATWFLFDRSFSIYGGNIASTLAGEFAFSISLTLAVLYLGVLGRGLETGRHRALAAGLLALTTLCHLIPLFFALAGTVIWFVLRPGIARLRYLATVLPVAGLLTAFWTVPFYLRHGYMNDMGWEKKETFVNYLFTRDRLDPQLVDAPGIRWVLALAAVGALMSIAYGVLERNRAGLFWVGIAVVAALGFWLAPQGRLWNARLLPFYYLSLYCLAAIGVAYVVRTVGVLMARDPRRPVRAVTIGGAVVALVAGLVVVALPLRAMPERIPFTDVTLATDDPSGGYRWLFLPTVRDNSFIDSWARWNYEGYERKAAYPEYHDIVQTMARVGAERGCGRAMWEHEEEHDRYGTPMALMLLPFWTDGCIGSMEGLYFEASSTTPYHFLNQDELSSAPSNAQRDLPYGAGAPSQADFDRGIAHLQLMGVRYYLAISDRMIEFAGRNPALTEVATSGPWHVYEVAGSELVSPMTAEPAVLTGLPDDGKGWLEPAVDWYMDPDRWSVPLSAGGPLTWQRVGVDEQPETRPLPPVVVSDIEEGTDRLSFRVDRTGVPVLVKVSYFPNWTASGAQGPWRVTPNLMVVVPTDNEVELSFGLTWVEYLAWLLTLVGVAGLVWLVRAPPVPMPAPRSRPVAGEGFLDVPVAPVEPGQDATSAQVDPARIILGPFGPQEPAAPDGAGGPETGPTEAPG